MTTETEIANLAIQRVGGTRIADGALRTEDSSNAAEMRVAYDHYRRAELRRNVWRFSIREQFLRPLDTTTEDVIFGVWDDVQTYGRNDIVRGSNGKTYIAKTEVPSSVNQDPVTDYSYLYWTEYIGSTVANLWGVETNFMAGELAYSSDISINIYTYMSMQNGNLGNDIENTNYWMRFIVTPSRLVTNFIYPIGAGPLSDIQTLNVFKLPYGFVRVAPQAPKQGSYMFLGAPSALAYSDWNFESNYFTSVQAGPIPFRFAAAVSDPNEFDPMFIDGFSARLAFELCERLTQSSAKKAELGGTYNKFMSEARIVNGIETGPVEAPEDTYLTVRY